MTDNEVIALFEETGILALSGNGWVASAQLDPKQRGRAKKADLLECARALRQIAEVVEAACLLGNQGGVGRGGN